MRHAFILFYATIITVSMNAKRKPIKTVLVLSNLTINVQEIQPTVPKTHIYYIAVCAGVVWVYHTSVWYTHHTPAVLHWWVILCS